MSDTGSTIDSGTASGADPFAVESIADAVFNHARIRPEAPALYEGRAAVTWRELAAQVAAASGWLVELGIGAQAPVGLMLANSVEHVVLSFALMRVGATPVEIPLRTPGEQLALIAGRLGLALIFTETEMPALKGRRAIVIGAGWRPDPALAMRDARADTDPDRQGIVTLSSGGSGVPTAHFGTHRQRIARCARHELAFGAHWSVARPGTLVLTGSLASAAQHNFFISQMLRGGPVALTPQLASAGDYVRALKSWDDAVCWVIPPLFRDFLRSGDERHPLFPMMQMMVVGGGELQPDEKRAGIVRVAANLYEIYGASGSGMIAKLPPEAFAAKSETVGAVMPDMEVEIVDADERPLPPGRTGRLRCRGATLGARVESLKDGGGTGDQLRGGWYYPGDLASLDADGFLTFKGRLADRIVQGGAELHPSEVEGAIAALPGVTEVAVVGRPSADGGQDAVAFVVKAESVSHEQMLAHCTAVLSATRVPRLFAYVRGLPRTAAGKIDRPALRQFAAKQVQPVTTAPPQPPATRH